MMTESASGGKSAYILGMRVDLTSYKDAAGVVRDWAQQGLSRYVCVACVNNVMEAYDSDEFRQVMNRADLVTPDGMPLVLGLRLLASPNATRVYGPDLTPVLLEMAAAHDLPVGFYGGSQPTLDRLRQAVTERVPGLRIVYAFSPPFRPLTPEEDEQVTRNVNASGARILFIGLNSPKQDHWMAAHRGQIQAVMVGVGAAFDFLAGVKPQAPRWMRNSGLEWLFRFVTEPRRLWKRYLKHNPRFVYFFALQLLRIRRFADSRQSKCPSE